MALNKGNFQQAFGNFFTDVKSLPTTVETAGAKWASLYAVYATNAVAGVTEPTPASITEAQVPLAKDLSGAFSSTTSPGDLASRMAGAFATFWKAVMFQTGTATGEVEDTHSPELQNALEGFFSGFSPNASPPPTPERQANDLASLFDSWTHTVTVVNTINGQVQPAVALA